MKQPKTKSDRLKKGDVVYFKRIDEHGVPRVGQGIFVRRATAVGRQGVPESVTDVKYDGETHEVRELLCRVRKDAEGIVRRACIKLLDTIVWRLKDLG